GSSLEMHSSSRQTNTFFFNCDSSNELQKSFISCQVIFYSSIGLNTFPSPLDWALINAIIAFLPIPNKVVPFEGSLPSVLSALTKDIFLLTSRITSDR